MTFECGLLNLVSKKTLEGGELRGKKKAHSGVLKRLGASSGLVSRGRLRPEGGEADGSFRTER